MAFNPKVYVKFNSTEDSNPVLTIWNWCESMNIQFDFLGFDTRDTPETFKPVSVSIWQIPDEMDNIAFRLRWT